MLDDLPGFGAKNIHNRQAPIGRFMDEVTMDDYEIAFGHKALERDL